MFLNLGSYKPGTDFREIVFKGKDEYGTENRQKTSPLWVHFPTTTAAQCAVLPSRPVKYPGILAVGSNVRVLLLQNNYILNALPLSPIQINT